MKQQHLVYSPIRGRPAEAQLHDQAFLEYLSEEERDQLDAAHARNEPLMAKLLPLGKRKEAFKETLTTTHTTYRRELSGLTCLLLGGRFWPRRHRRELRVVINRGSRVLLGVRQTASLPDRFDGIELVGGMGASTAGSAAATAAHRD